MNDRLQFRHHSPIFDTRERAIDYIFKDIKNARSGITRDDETLKYSLFSEPAVLRYKNDEDDYKIIETTSLGEVIYDPNEVAPNPHVILAIGSNTNNTQSFNENRYCIIDIDKTEQEIADLWEYIENSLKGLSIITKDSNTLKLYGEKTSDGTVISGDVVVAESQIFDDRRRPNTLLNTKDGLFTFVKLEFTPGDDKFTFIVNGETTEVPLYDYYIVRGYYDRKDESLHLIRKDGIDVKVSLENLVGEWSVEGEASKTPIVLTREEIGYGDDALHNHVEPWQDVLKADVRIDSGRTYNILSKTNDGRYLYVDGVASNITYFKDGEAITVQDALKSAMKNASNDSTNIIYEKVDGLYATAQLKYKNKENKLIFTTSNSTGGTTVEEINLNAVEAFDDIYYNPSTETLVIKYTDGSGDIKTVEIPIGEMMTEWEWDIQNEGHNVKLHKTRVIAGNDKVSADVKIYNDVDNILVDKNHELFVKGTADNIKYGRDGNVSDALDKLNANDADINARLNETSGKVDTLRAEFDAEVERATTEEQRIESKLNDEISRSKEKDVEHSGKISTIEQTIGDGFTTDGHETVTYKFNELSAKTNSVSAKTDTISANLGLLSAKTEAEIVRAKGEEQRIEKKFDDALGDGFNIRNTVRDEFNKEKSERIGEDARLQARIDALSASTEGKLVDVINIDHSINVDKTDLVKPVIKVNLSDETIEGMQNVIKRNNDGLYAGVDLDYYFESGTSKNVLVFKTTNGTKTFDLKTNSVVDKIYYDPTKEAIIIEYTVDGKRMPDVVVPVHDLINEWRVSEDTNGAIKLHKFRESGATQDVLYAESIISSHEDNILVNDNGSLYVSGKPITDLKNRMDSVEERVDAAEADIDALENGLAAEVARATGEEQRIEGKLDREIERSIGEDGNLWENLRSEIARATDKDNEHDTAIANEVARAQNVERSLQDEIAEETRRAINSESTLSAKIDSEIERSSEKDSQHDSLISGLRADLNNEITRSTSEDNSIRSALTAEETARISSDTTLGTKIESEKNRAIGEEQRIEERLNNEISRSVEKDTYLENKTNTNEANIANEILDRTNGDIALHEEVITERDRATLSENSLRTDLSTEIQNRANGDRLLQSAIDSEASFRQNTDASLQAQITSLASDVVTERSERISSDNIIDSKVTEERNRAIQIENNLRGDLNAEIVRATNKETELSDSISNEINRAISAETNLQVALNAEINRSTTTDSLLEHKIDDETDAREAEDARIWYDLNDNKLVFKDTNSITFNRTENEGAADDVMANVKLSVKPGNVLSIVDGVNAGLYSTAVLKYNSSTNVLGLYRENDTLISEQRLGGGALLDSITYDKENKNLIIKYHNNEGPQETILGVADIFNEWMPENPSEGSAIELWKTENVTESGTIDKISGKVLITSVKNPDGSVDYGDNIIRIVNNGLYASGSGITKAVESTECTKNELKSLERAVLGQNIGQECGNGYTYTPNMRTCFISAATSMQNADEIIDSVACENRNRIINLEEDVNCLQNELDVTQQNVIGFNVPPCGEKLDGTKYKYEPNGNTCFIKDATSLNNADVILDEYVCSAHTRINILDEKVNCISGEVESVENVLGVTGNCSDVITYPKTDGCILSSAMTFAQADRLLEDAICGMHGTEVLGTDTPTISINSVEETEDEYRVSANVRLSHGNVQMMEDSDLNIVDYNGSMIEEGIYEFTDTNVLRIVDLTESAAVSPSSKFNGLYLSNIWDCGQYTLNGEGTPFERYKTDENETARNLYANKYRNGVRYQNG